MNRDQGVENAPTLPGLWHFVCITRLGKVSMVRNLSLDVARRTYQSLLPGTRPKTYIRSEVRGSRFSAEISTYGPNDDWLEKVEVIGPYGEDLDPWYGVEPTIVDQRTAEERALASQGKDRNGGEG